MPRPAERVALLEEAKATADPTTLHYLVCEVNQIEPLLELGDLATARHHSGHVAELVEALNLPWRDEILLPRAGDAFHAGRLDEAAAIALEVLATFQEQFVQAFAGGVLLAATREQDRAADLIPIVLERVDQPEWRAAAAALLAEAGRDEEARSLLEGLVPALRGYQFSCLGLVLAGDAAAGIGDARFAAEVSADLAPWSGLLVSVGGYFTLGTVDRVLGRLAAARGDLAGARRLLEAAVEQTRTTGSALLLAQAQLDLAEVLAADGAGDAAAALRRDVARVATELGLARLARLAGAPAA